jgi:hypothetical protein
LRFAVALAGILACEQRFSSDPPLVPETPGPSSSSGAIEALLAPSTVKASAFQDSSHAMTVTLCSSSPKSCLTSEGDASAEGSYFVVFGSGRGILRSHEQAITDLYQELRNRMAAGEHLDVEPHAPGAASSPIAVADSWTTKANVGSSDPIAQCAVHVFDVVDRVGEVSLDVVHGVGSSGCLVSLSAAAADGGAFQCLVQAPERARNPLPGGKGLRW